MIRTVWCTKQVASLVYSLYVCARLPMQGLQRPCAKINCATVNGGIINCDRVLCMHMCARVCWYAAPQPCPRGITLRQMLVLACAAICTCCTNRWPRSTGPGKNNCMHLHTKGQLEGKVVARYSCHAGGAAKTHKNNTCALGLGGIFIHTPAAGRRCAGLSPCGCAAATRPPRLARPPALPVIP